MAVEERMKLIIAQIVAILLEKWETYTGLKEQQYPSVAALMIKLREFWSKHNEDVCDHFDSTDRRVHTFFICCVLDHEVLGSLLKGGTGCLQVSI